MQSNLLVHDPRVWLKLAQHPQVSCGEDTREILGVSARYVQVWESPHATSKAALMVALWHGDVCHERR